MKLRRLSRLNTFQRISRSLPKLTYFVKRTCKHESKRNPIKAVMNPVPKYCVHEQEWDTSKCQSCLKNSIPNHGRKEQHSNGRRTFLFAETPTRFDRFDLSKLCQRRILAKSGKLPIRQNLQGLLLLLLPLLVLVLVLQLTLTNTANIRF